MTKNVTLSSLFCLLFLGNNAQAQHIEQIVCKTDATQLSRQFAEHWEHSWPEWWSSWAHDYISGKMLVGGMRTIENTEPHDKNPHLKFIQADVGTVDQVFIAICRYRIGNRELMDIDNMLEMRVMVPASLCKVVSNTTIQCYEERGF